MQQPLHRAVVHLEARILGTHQVRRLVGGGFDQRADSRALLRQIEVVPGHLDRHARLDVALAALERAQGLDLLVRVEPLGVVGHTLSEEGRQAIDALALVARVLNGVEEGLLPIGGDVLCGVAHGVAECNQMDIIAGRM